MDGFLEEMHRGTLIPSQCSEIPCRQGQYMAMAWICGRLFRHAQSY